MNFEVAPGNLITEGIIGHEIEDLHDANWDKVELLRNLMGDELFQSELTKSFNPDTKKDYLAVHHEICSIPFLSYITTNYDYCLENAIKATLKQVTVQYYPELDFSRIRNGDVYHIHGVIKPNKPGELFGSVILSNRDYEKAYEPNTGLPRFLANLFEIFTIVFIGYSFGDSN